MVIDEVEKMEREETRHLLKTIINLSFVAILKEKVKLEVRKEHCNGNARPISDEEVDVKNLIFYFDEGLAAISWEELWETVCDICHFLNIPLDNSWKFYLPQLANLTVPVLHQALLELKNYPESSTVTSIVCSIIHHEHFKIHKKMYTY